MSKSRASFLVSASAAVLLMTMPVYAQVIDYTNGEDKSAPIVLNNDTTQLQTLSGVTATQSGIISESGGARPLEKIGAGTLILTADNTYTGITTITAGTLQIGNNGTKSWPGESEQGDKWIFCLTAARIAANQERS